MWLDANQTAEKEEYKEKKALEGISMPILQKMASGGMGGMPDIRRMGEMPDIGGASAPLIEDSAGGPTIDEIG